MGTNKVVEVVAGTKLRLKSSASFPLTPNQRSKLLDSVALAKLVLRRASLSLGTLRPGSGAPTEAAFASILQAHFKRMPRAVPATSLGFEPEVDKWDPARRTITSAFDAMVRGLCGDLTIADAYSSTRALLDRKANESALMNIQMLIDRRQKAEDQFRDSGDLDDYDEIEKVDRLRLSAKQDYVQERREGERTARNTSGYVKHHVVDAHRRTDSTAPPLRSDQKGSIHINFQTLLTEPRFSQMNVALTIIHEAAHKFIDAFDFAYTFEPHYQQLTPDQMLRNADSYAFTAVSVYLRRLVRSATDLYEHSA